MINKRKKNLKRFTYICLSLTSIMISTNLQAMESSSEDDEIDRRSHLSVSQSENRKEYNFIGIALFSGEDPVGKAIKKVTHSEISHVGIILADAKDESIEKWICFESTGSASEVLHGHYPHVRPSTWEDTMRYHGKVSYRLAVFEDRERTDSKIVTDFVEEYDGKSYTKNPLKLLKALYRKNKESKSKSPSTVFCSELAAKMLMDLDIINKDIASNKLPKDFASEGNIIPNSGIIFTEAFPANFVKEN